MSEKETEFRISIGGRFSVEGRFFDDDNRKRSGVRVGDVIPAFRGAWGPFDTLVRTDLRGTDDHDRILREAWARWSPHPSFRVSAGLLKVDFGSEFATSLGLLSLPGRSFVSHLNGVYDVGAEIAGGFAPDDEVGESIHYAAFVTGGVGYGLEGQGANDPIAGVRLLVRPLAWTGVRWLRGISVGGSIAYSPTADAGIHLVTPLESVVFATPRVRARRSFRRNIELAYHCGPVRARLALAHWAISGARWNGMRDDLDQNGAWAAEAAWMVTGQPYRYGGGREGGVEMEPVGAEASPYGGVELAARYSNADIDRAWFERGITNYDPSTQEVRTFTGGLNWYARRNLRVMLAWVHTIADHELTTFGGGNRDRSILLRLQIRF